LGATIVRREIWTAAAAAAGWRALTEDLINVDAQDANMMTVDEF